MLELKFSIPGVCASGYISFKVSAKTQLSQSQGQDKGQISFFVQVKKKVWQVFCWETVAPQSERETWSLVGKSSCWQEYASCSSCKNPPKSGLVISLWTISVCIGSVETWDLAAKFPKTQSVLSITHLLPAPRCWLHCTCLIPTQQLSKLHPEDAEAEQDTPSDAAEAGRLLRLCSRCSSATPQALQPVRLEGEEGEDWKNK